MRFALALLLFSSAAFGQTYNSGWSFDAYNGTFAGLWANNVGTRTVSNYVLISDGNYTSLRGAGEVVLKSGDVTVAAVGCNAAGNQLEVLGDIEIQASAGGANYGRGMRIMFNEDAGQPGDLLVSGGPSLPAHWAGFEHGADAGTSGLLSIAFRAPFSTSPDCTCSERSSAAPCVVLAESTVGVTFAGYGSDVLSWVCAGDR